MKLHNKRAVVTGGAAGIGAAIVRRFCSAGASVVIADLDFDAASALASGLNNAYPVAADVSDPESVKFLIQFTNQKLGGIDIFVNNAGIGTASLLEETEVGTWDKLMDVNLKGTFLCMKYAIPQIRKNGGGSIINIASIAALIGLPNRAVYSATKGAIIAMSRAAAIDHVSENIRINCIAPGTTDTPWIDRITGGSIEVKNSMIQRQPHGRLVTPDEIAAMAEYLASDDAASVIGSVMVVDGGAVAK